MLIIVLVVVAMLALGAYTYSDLMITERDAVDLYGEQLQARALAESGVDAARLFLMQDWETRYQLGGVYDNAGNFAGGWSSTISTRAAAGASRSSPR